VQQAQARVDARRIIVQGATQITQGAINALNNSGINLSNEDIGQLTTSLMALTCSD